MSLDVGSLSQALEGQSPEAILREAADRFGGRIALATSFGIEDCVLIDMVGRAGLKIDPFTLDTGLLFPETYELWARLEAKYGIKIRGAKATATLEEQAAEHGPELWTRAPDRCCDLRKVQPLRSELSKFDAWVTGIRRDQTPDRANAQIVENDKRFGLIKFNPLVAWTSKDVWKYVMSNGVPYNPLHDQGYPSIGCLPCTSPVAAGEDPRSGRWRGSVKTECGLHVETKPGAEQPLTHLATGR
jgi:phosphoadenylyl-sulfate reductase (thioredoxin)